MKAVKLSSNEMRAWRQNQAHWVDPKGLVIRAVTPEEEAAIFPAVQDAKRVGRSGIRTVQAKYQRVSGDGAVQHKTVPFQIQFDVRRTGNNPREFVLEMSVAGNRYVKAREIIEKRLLAKHGSFMLHGVNGKRLKVVRDPEEHRPSFSDNRSTPRPQFCVCASWIGTVPGRHHPSCDFNRYAPIDERAEGADDTYQPLDDAGNPTFAPAFEIPLPGQAGALSSPGNPGSQPGFSPPSPQALGSGGQEPPQPSDVLTGLSSQGKNGLPTAPPVVAQPQLPVAGQGSVTTAVSPMAPTVAHTPHLSPAAPQSPEECDQDCRGLQSGTSGWAWPRGRRPEPGQHHPLCKHADSWRRHEKGKTQKLLYDTKRMRPLREATEEEVAQSEISLGRNGVATVLVSGAVYAVVDESDVGPDGKILDRSMTERRRRPAQLAPEATTPTTVALAPPPLPTSEAASPVPPAPGEPAEQAEPAEEPPDPPGGPWAEPEPRLGEPERPEGGGSEPALRDERGLVGAQRGDGKLSLGVVPSLAQTPQG